MADIDHLEVVELTKKEFDDLGEYSCTLPTGTTIGKRWKRNLDEYDETDEGHVARAETKMAGIFPAWILGEYYELDPPVPGEVGIRWRRIKLKEASGNA